MAFMLMIDAGQRGYEQTVLKVQITEPGVVCDVAEVRVLCGPDGWTVILYGPEGGTKGSLHFSRNSYRKRLRAASAAEAAGGMRSIR
jgi:hypothetical protein